MYTPMNVFFTTEHSRCLRNWDFIATLTKINKLQARMDSKPNFYKLQLKVDFFLFSAFWHQRLWAAHKLAKHSQFFTHSATENITCWSVPTCNGFKLAMLDVYSFSSRKWTFQYQIWLSELSFCRYMPILCKLHITEKQMNKINRVLMVHKLWFSYE
jgi:hypothetical protein